MDQNKQKRCLCLNYLKKQNMGEEYGCIAQFRKNETATLFFLKKPSLVMSAFNKKAVKIKL